MWAIRSVTHAAIRQRWLVVHTHAARQRAEKTLRKQHLTLSETESKAFKRLQGKTFACEADATAAVQAFRFLKDPVFLSPTLFLKTPRRIRTLMAIMTLCLLVYAAVQWRVRQALQQSQQTYPDQKGKPNPRPTARRVFH